MDPVAHTLVGAALAETGLKRASRYATACLLIGANLADVDALAHLWGDDTALYLRRGLTHGVLALVALPLLLTAGLWLWHRWRGARADDSSPPFRPGAILALSFLAVWTHPLLDWLNTYGVRLLMPFDQRWFYGDTLFIIDPWVWLLAAAGVLLARSHGRLALTGWIVLAALTSALVLVTDRAPLAVKLVWLAGVALLAVLRWRRPWPSAAVARFSFATLVLYVCAVYGVARLAEAEAAARFPAPLEAQANPSPGVPFAHRLVLVYDDRYRIVQPHGDVTELPRRQPDAVVRQALADESVRGFVNWMRYPYWQVEETPQGWRVRIWDLRYQQPDRPQRGIGYAEVLVPKR